MCTQAEQESLYICYIQVDLLSVVQHLFFGHEIWTSVTQHDMQEDSRDSGGQEWEHVMIWSRLVTAFAKCALEHDHRSGSVHCILDLVYWHSLVKG